MNNQSLGTLAASALIVLHILPGPSYAATTYSYWINPYGSRTGDVVFDSSPVPISRTFIQDESIYTSGFGKARSSYGGDLGAASTQSYMAPPGNDRGESIDSRAMYLVDDVIITGPSDVSTVFVSLNLELAGSFFGGVGVEGRENDNDGKSSLSLLGRVHETPFSGQAELLVEYAEGRYSQVGARLTKEGSGLLTNLLAGAELGSSGTWPALYDYSVIEFLTTDPIEVPLGTPFEIYLELRAVSGTNGQGGRGYVETNFYDSLKLSSGPIFTLPDGYTANSESGGIVDNQLTPVPIPPAILMLGSGLLGLLSLLKSSAVARRHGSPSLT